MKFRLVGWAANCQSSEVGTPTTQPLGINSGQDLGGCLETEIFLSLNQQ